MIFILRKRPFTAAETAQMADEWPGVRPLIVPGRHVEEPYASLLSGQKTLAQFVAEAPARVDPVFDDRPFFFARQKPWGLPGGMRTASVGTAFALAAAITPHTAAFLVEPVQGEAGIIVPPAGYLAHCAKHGLSQIQLSKFGHVVNFLFFEYGGRRR
jgi:hypothetical protein